MIALAKSPMVIGNKYTIQFVIASEFLLPVLQALSADNVNPLAVLQVEAIGSCFHLNSEFASKAPDLIAQLGTWFNQYSSIKATCPILAEAVDTAPKPSPNQIASEQYEAWFDCKHYYSRQE